MLIGDDKNHCRYAFPVMFGEDVAETCPLCFGCFGPHTDKNVVEMEDDMRLEPVRSLIERKCTGVVDQETRCADER